MTDPSRKAPSLMEVLADAPAGELAVFAALLVCAVATALLVLWAIWRHQADAEFEDIARHRAAMHALDRRHPTR